MATQILGTVWSACGSAQLIHGIAQPVHVKIVKFRVGDHGTSWYSALTGVESAMLVGCPMLHTSKSWCGAGVAVHAVMP